MCFWSASADRVTAWPAWAGDWERLDIVPATPLAALQAVAKRHPGRDAWLIEAGTDLPDAAWSRLSAAWQDTSLDVLSPLSRSDVGDTARPLAELDAASWNYSPHAVFATGHADAACSLWRGAALARGAVNPRQALPLDLRAGLLPALVVDPPTTSQAVFSQHLAVQDLRSLLRELPAIATRLPGADARSVLLHVLHGWGGGAERFVRDQMECDEPRRHLVLVSRGDPDKKRHGERLALHHDLDAPPLREWTLGEPIASTRAHCADVQAILAEIIADWPIGAVLVSSLIGHSLDVLRTGLPTAVCAHDAYPLWPRLHGPFAPGQAYTFDALREALADGENDDVFERQSVETWWALREAYLEALTRFDISLVAPSESSRQRLCTIAPVLARRPWQVIGHGHRPFPIAAEMPARQDRRRLRVLVPGHLNGDKGERLIRDLIDRLPDSVELLLCGVGIGRIGERFHGHRNVHLLRRYARDELPALAAALDPDMALLPSTVPETWSYALSEMQALRLPVLCPRLGAYAERLERDGGGWLVAPSAEAIAAQLLLLAQAPETIATMRGRIPSPPSLSDSLAAWRQALPTERRPLRLARANATQLALLDARLGVDRSEQSQRSTQQALQQSEKEVLARGEWALRLQDEVRAGRQAQAAERQHGDDLQVRLHDREQALVAKQESERVLLTQLHALEAQWAQSRQRELELQLALRESQAERDAAIDRFENERQLRQRALDAQEKALQSAHDYYQRDTQDLAQQRDVALDQRDALQSEFASILRSRSWRLTAPLRVIVRKFGQLPATWRFRLAQLRNWSRRGLASLRNRGLVGTWRRLRQRPSAPPRFQASVPQPGATTDLRFQVQEAPRASIIVPVYNQLAYTLGCLQALAQCGDTASFEIIVVDDGSSDDTARVIAAIPGLRFQRNPHNLGFIGACNAGAAFARGDYLVFLNNDTAVQAGWLDALLRTFVEHPDTGLAGSKLVYPDGRLQEAGGIVFSDGSGWNYGRFDDPADPRYNYVREADYCSGAAIALRRHLFESLAGFDSRYTPAYYEDTDLAMRVRERGLKVRYQPASVVVHFEGISSGTDLSQGVKAHQVVNQKKFLERWSDALAARHPPPGTDVMRAREHRCRHRVLVLDACTPTPDRDSGSLRMIELLRQLLDLDCAVSFFPENRAHDGRYTEALQQLGVEAWWHPWLQDVPAWLKAHGSRFDTVIVSRHYILSPLLPLLRQYAPQARLVFDTVDLHFLREEREAELAADPARQRAAARTRADELALIAASDLTWVVSPVEQSLLQRTLPGARIEVLSNIHSPRGAGPDFGSRRDLVFVGGYRHPPNVDAALWLIDDLYPRIRALRPDIRLHLVGGDAPDSLRRRAEQPGIRFHGYVSDLEALLDTCRVTVAPLRYGAGVKGKINQSLALGLPVVASHCAVEGMHLQHEIDALVADDAAGFVEAVLRLYEDAALWQRLVEGGLENTRRHFSPEAARAALRSALGLS